jgi:hypothetical protein
MWYAVKLLLEANVSDDLPIEPLREESIRLIQANSHQEAETVARKFGLDLECNYANERGDQVEWKFVSVLEVQDLCEGELYSGMEVFSKLFRGKTEQS